MAGPTQGWEQLRQTIRALLASVFAFSGASLAIGDWFTPAFAAEQEWRLHSVLVRTRPEAENSEKLAAAVNRRAGDRPMITVYHGDSLGLKDVDLLRTPPNFGLVMSVIHCGRVHTLSCTMTHHQDVGGTTPGSVPTNGNCFHLVQLTLPEGSLLNPVEPAPVKSRTQTIKIAAAYIVGAFAGVVPEKVPASDAVDQHTLMWGGRRGDGTPFVVGECIAAGIGGSMDQDGRRSRSLVLKRGGGDQEIRSKEVTTVKKGKRPIVEVAGGSGFGDPRDRDRGAVLVDVKVGKISAQAALEAYGVTVEGD